AIEYHDWRSMAAEERRQRLARLQCEDFTRDFDLAEAPAARMSLVAWESGIYRVVWSFHHILMDGWSWTIVARDFLRALQARLDSKTARIVPSGSFQNYVTWLGTQNREAT